jgi:hypothetical protein
LDIGFKAEESSSSQSFYLPRYRSSDEALYFLGGRKGILIALGLFVPGQNLKFCEISGISEQKGRANKY